jgi:hypothetical protein
MRSFDSWNYEEVEDLFGLTSFDELPNLDAWLAGGEDTTFQPNVIHHDLLEHYRKLLFQQVKNWNEDELKLFFIGPLLGLIDFTTEYFKPYTQRNLSISKNGIETAGKVDFLLAKGKILPKIPYFCLHEYKQENRRDNDPLGQLLIGMVAAQAKNEKNIPIYGTYVSGRNWFFVLLEGDQYACSNAYNASDDDVYRIYGILNKCKKLIYDIAQG